MSSPLISTLSLHDALPILLILACVAAALCPVNLEPWITASVWTTAACALVGFLTLPIAAQRTARFERVRRVVAGLQIYLTRPDRKSTRLNSSHRCISYAVF